MMLATDKNGKSKMSQRKAKEDRAIVAANKRRIGHKISVNDPDLEDVHDHEDSTDKN